MVTQQVKTLPEDPLLEDPLPEDRGMSSVTDTASLVELLIDRPVSPGQSSDQRSGASILPGQRRCPEIADSERPLVIHTIDHPTCETRQRDGYHKCGSCTHMTLASFRGNGLPPLDNCPSNLADTRLADLQRLGARLS